MKIDAVGVTTSNLSKTVEFYTILGFSFPEYKDDEDHLEATSIDGSSRLMIDNKTVIKDVVGKDPKPANHSNFGVHYDSAEQINNVIANLETAGFKIFKKPWDAVWGQRYAIVEDPDGYKIDLYSPLVVN